MGFRKPDLGEATRAIQASLLEIRSPYNDGFTAAYCKRDLYQLKLWLDDEYAKLPKFSGEEQWEQEHLIKILKKE